MTIPAFENNSITDRVKAGRNPLTKADVESLVADGVTHILDLREPHEWSIPWDGQEAIDEIGARGIVRMHLPIEDFSAPSLQTLESALGFINAALEDPKARVYVHCRAGIERTGCVLVAWYARQRGVDFDTAVAELRGKRAMLRPGYLQAEVVRKFLAGSSPEASSG